MANVIREKVIPVPVDALYAAITDFEHYPDFLPEVVAAKKIAGKDPNIVRVTFTLEVVKRFDYTLEFTMTPKTEVKWALIESNFFKTNTGRWGLKANGNETQVQYELDVSFGFLVPGWISRKLTEVSLPKMFENFESQAKKKM
jgi:coenzyme Q-binding protein COQ10